GQARVPARPHDPDGDFAPVGDQHLTHEEVSSRLARSLGGSAQTGTSGPLAGTHASQPAR
ncbi:MAG TPA: hypothetical protein VMV92_31615, partial [Streptosporangiaceae bacterium]|nr:hypothetical protein [Streptosporangiaceae bacterium]